MQGDGMTLSAPVMFIGLLLGFFLCFYGYVAKRLLVSIRSIFAGSLVFLAIALLLSQQQALLQSLASPTPLTELWNVIFNTQDYTGVLINLLSFSVGGLLLFYLSRTKSNSLQLVVASFTGVSMGLVIFLLILGFLPLQTSFVIFLILQVIILAYCLIRFTSYMALESAIAGSLIVAYLLSQFWYLGFWLFFALWAILAFLGILNQMHRLGHRKQSKEQANG